MQQVEAIFERLDMLLLFETLMHSCSARDRKDLSYVGGIRLSAADLGYPAPYANVETYVLADGRRQATRDPGDGLWAQVFDELVKARAPQGQALQEGLSEDRKGDLLELTLGAAQLILDMDERVSASSHLQRCLNAARVLIEDLARTLEELQLRRRPGHELLCPTVEGVSVTDKQCPRCAATIFGRWSYGTWTGAESALWRHQCV